VKAYKSVRVDFERLRSNVRALKARTGRAILAVVKADAYGLGLPRIAPAIADDVDGFCVFSLSEAVSGRLWQRTGKEAIALGPPETLDPTPWLEAHVRPAVANVVQAKALATADPLVAVDTGMHRFTCEPENLAAVVEAGKCREAFTHGLTLAHVERLKTLTAGMDLRLHAAASSLLDEPAGWLDAVRPGLALYDQAVRVTSHLLEIHSATGPIGYTGFHTPRHGVIPVGYSGGLHAGACIVNGIRRRILEVGMQTSYVEVGPEDRVNDAVVLLGDGLDVREVANAWGMKPQEALMRLGKE
jgi:alanine racemase